VTEIYGFIEISLPSSVFLRNDLQIRRIRTTTTSAPATPAITAIIQSSRALLSSCLGLAVGVTTTKKKKKQTSKHSKSEGRVKQGISICPPQKPFLIRHDSCLGWKWEKLLLKSKEADL